MDRNNVYMRENTADLDLQSFCGGGISGIRICTCWKLPKLPL
jgi:hypothetical protein